MAQNPVVTFEMENGDLIKAELYPEIAPNTVNNFISLVKKGHAKLYIGLAMYKPGSSARDNTGIPEWKRYDDIISRQGEAGRASGSGSGYCFYEYGSFQEDVCQKEVKNLMKVLR